MRFTGSADFVADSSRVWAFLVDPAGFGPCSPVPIERVDDRHYIAKARIGSGFFAATLRMDIEVVDVVPDRSARLVAHGGATGTTVDGSSTFVIRPATVGGVTTVDWDVEITVSGMLAGPAERLIGDRAQAAMEQLLACVHRQVEG